VTKKTYPKEKSNIAESRASIVRCRLQMKLPTLRQDDRQCMRCNKKFLSEGAHNRMCSDCRTKRGEYII